VQLSHRITRLEGMSYNFLLELLSTSEGVEANHSNSTQPSGGVCYAIVESRDSVYFGDAKVIPSCSSQ